MGRQHLTCADTGRRFAMDIRRVQSSGFYRWRERPLFWNTIGVAYIGHVFGRQGLCTRKRQNSNDISGSDFASLDCSRSPESNLDLISIPPTKFNLSPTPVALPTTTAPSQTPSRSSSPKSTSTTWISHRKILTLKTSSPSTGPSQDPSRRRG